MKTIKNCLNTINKKIILAIFSLLLIGYSQCGYGVIDCVYTMLVPYPTRATTAEVTHRLPDIKIIDEDIARHIAWIFQTPGLRSVRITWTDVEINEEAIPIIMKALKENKTLTEFIVKFKNSNITDSAVNPSHHAFVKELLNTCLNSDNMSLEYFGIMGCGSFTLNHEDTLKIASLLKKNGTLRRLDLIKLGIDDHHAKIITEACPHNNIQRNHMLLCLYDNPITFDGLVQCQLISNRGLNNPDVCFGHCDPGSSCYSLSNKVTLDGAFNQCSKTTQNLVYEMLVAGYVMNDVRFGTNLDWVEKLNPQYSSLVNLIKRRNQKMRQYESQEVMYRICQLSPVLRPVALAFTCGIHPRLGADSPTYDNMDMVLLGKKIFTYLKTDLQTTKSYVSGLSYSSSSAVWILTATDEDIVNLKLDDRSRFIIREIREDHNAVMCELKALLGEESFDRATKLLSDGFKPQQALEKAPHEVSDAPAPSATGETS